MRRTHRKINQFRLGQDNQGWYIREFKNKQKPEKKYFDSFEELMMFVKPLVPDSKNCQLFDALEKQMEKNNVEYRKIQRRVN